MFSDVDLVFTNSLSDDLNQNSVTSVIFIANVPEFTASDHFEQTRSMEGGMVQNSRNQNGFQHQQPACSSTFSF